MRHNLLITPATSVDWMLATLSQVLHPEVRERVSHRPPLPDVLGRSPRPRDHPARSALRVATARRRREGRDRTVRIGSMLCFSVASLANFCSSTSESPSSSESGTPSDLSAGLVFADVKPAPLLLDLLGAFGAVLLLVLHLAQLLVRWVRLPTRRGRRQDSSREAKGRLIWESPQGWGRYAAS